MTQAFGAQSRYKIGMMSTAIVFTDGAASGNPGPGGWGAICLHQGIVTELGGGERHTTNNRMEIMATLQALKFLSSTNATIRLFTDSTYVIQGITTWIHQWIKNDWLTKEGKPVANPDLWKELLAALRALPRQSVVSWEKCKGHAGIPGNERADRIAVSFSQGNPLILFKGEATQYPIDLHQLEAVPFKKVYLSLVDGKLQRHPTWLDCEARVKGTPGARFKKVSSVDEEAETLKSWGIISVENH